jgi:hypothetical protein
MRCCVLCTPAWRQDAQRVPLSHKVHAQLVRWASERQPRQPDEARETARHVEIGAFTGRYAEIGALRHTVTWGPALLFRATSALPPPRCRRHHASVHHTQQSMH